MHVEPGSTVIIWFFQWCTAITSIAVAIMSAVLKNYASDPDNKKWWEDDKGDTPFKISKDKVEWDNNQTTYWNVGYAFIGIGILAFIGFLHLFLKNRSRDECWGRRGGAFLFHGMLSWIGTIFGLAWMIYGFTGIKLLNNKFMPNPGDGWDTPEIFMAVMIAWAAASALYSISITILYCAKRRSYKQYGGGYGQEMGMGGQMY